MEKLDAMLEGEEVDSEEDEQVPNVLPTNY